MHQSPEKIRQWLLERLSEAPLFELLGRDVLTMIAQRGAEFFYQDSVLRTEELIKWLTGEYGLPPDQTLEFFTSLQKAAAAQGIEIALPGSSPANTDSAPAATRPLKAPPPADHRRHPGSFLQDAAFHEWAVLDHARGDDAPKPEVVSKALLRLSLSGPEIELLADPSLEPGGAGDRPADWTLRLHGLSLALAAAVHIAASRVDFQQPQWITAVRELLANFDGVAVQVRAKLEREANEDSPLAEAWRRTSGLRDELTLRLDEMEGPGGAKAPAAASHASSDRAARPRRSPPDQGLRGRVNRRPLLVGALAVALVAAAGLLAWLLSGPETRPLDLTLDLESPRVEKIEAAPGLMIVTVDEASWTALDEQTKRSALQLMGEAAAKNGLATVNVRAADETPLGVYITSSGDFMILR